MEVIVINGFTRIREIEKFFNRLDPKVFKGRGDISLKQFCDMVTSNKKPSETEIILSETLSIGVPKHLKDVTYKYISFQDILSKKETLPEPAKGDVILELQLNQAIKELEAERDEIQKAIDKQDLYLRIARAFIYAFGLFLFYMLIETIGFLSQIHDYSFIMYGIFSALYGIAAFLFIKK